MTALCKLREAFRRGKPFKWNKIKGTADDTIPHRDIEKIKTAEPLSSSPSSAPVSLRPSPDQCPFCFFKDRLPPVDRDQHYTRINSLRRHVLRAHLNQASRHDYGLRGLHQPDSDSLRSRLKGSPGLAPPCQNVLPWGVSLLPSPFCIYCYSFHS